jgi:uncharacterized protein (TIGR02421 family)
MGTVTSANGAVAGNGRPLTPYQALIRSLSDRVVEAQRPIRLLEAIKWDASIERAFFAAGARELPPVSRDYYSHRPLAFDGDQKTNEFRAIERDLRKRLGIYNPAGQIMLRMCEEYRQVVDILMLRGTPGFAILSERLYGSSTDCIHAGEPSLADLGQLLSGILDNLSQEAAFCQDEPRLGARQTIEILSARLNGFFKEDGAVKFQICNDLVANAAAGCDYIKIREDACFSLRDVRLLEVHEGWVHVGTTLNGQAQPICTFLSKGPPSTTTTQEGLAVLTEVFAFASHPGRVRRLSNRIEGVALAEAGANFLEVYRFFLQQGHEPRDSYQQTMRIFRGSLPENCGPFTKDLCYSRGFFQVYNFIRLAVKRGMARRVPLLFCGKTNLADMKTLSQLVEEGLISSPKHVPPMFSDLHALSAWMCFANFLGGLSAARIEEDYAALF